MRGLIGKKVGMTRFFDKDTGREIPVTIIETAQNVVHQVKTVEKDGYRAVQLGYGIVPEKRVTKPLLGHFRKSNAAPSRTLKEFGLDEGETDPTLGQKVGVEVLQDVKFVDVIGTSKGRGYAGPIKRHNFHRGRETHGNTNHREPGSTGACSFPSRVFPGQRMAGQYGNAQCTIRRLEVVGVEQDAGLVYVKGSIPGRSSGIVFIRKCIDK
ncbi:MAG: 50S ribosomal protein L3 [Chitinivibrionales bacterium]|nr:50S ribosomal protein L3 [Chitinivibrionales bacterium]